METVEVVIRLPKEQYNNILNKGQVIALSGYEKMIGKGTVLPKGHTDLIDRQALIHSIEQKAKHLYRTSNFDTINGLCGAVAIVFDAPTIIEADKEDGQDGR